MIPSCLLGVRQGGAGERRPAGEQSRSGAPDACYAACSQMHIDGDGTAVIIACLFSPLGFFFIFIQNSM